LALVIAFFAASAGASEPQIGRWIFSGHSQICLEAHCPVTFSYMVRALPDEPNDDMRDKRDRGFAIECYRGAYELAYDVGRTFRGTAGQQIQVRILVDGAAPVRLVGEIEKDGYAWNGTVKASLSLTELTALAAARRSLTISVPGLQDFVAKADAAGAAISILRTACEWQSQ
jgi:hypothetical protein